MAATKFTVIFKSKETKHILTFELSFKTSYKTAVAIAKEMCNKSEDELIAVIESSKMFPDGVYESAIKLGEISYRL